MLMKPFSLFAALLMTLPLSSRADTYRLPFEGRWFVMQGGDTPNVNLHMQVRAQWYGVDFSKVGGPSERSLNTGDGRNTADFFSWGQPVLAPVNGTVVAVENSLPDNAVGVHDTDHVLGNHVEIKTTDGDYVFLAHLQKGSVQATVGKAVQAGDTLGKCGNSGNSDFPHVHMHVQNTPDLPSGLGRNVTFSGINVELSGKRFERVDWPLIRGLFVWR